MVIYYIHEEDEYMYKSKNHPPIFGEIGGWKNMIKYLRDKIEQYLISKEYKKLLKGNTLKPLTNFSHLNVIDI